MSLRNVGGPPSEAVDDSIRVRRCAPQSGLLGEVIGNINSGGWITRLLTDDSVFGVVELRCAGRFGPDRRECSERVCASLGGPLGTGCGRRCGRSSRVE